MEALFIFCFYTLALVGVPLVFAAAACLIWWLAVICIAAWRTLKNYIRQRKKPQHPSSTYRTNLRPAM